MLLEAKTRTQINRVPGSASVCCSPTGELCSGVGQYSLLTAIYFILFFKAT